MTPPTPRNTYLFERIFVCLAILSPIVMVIVAGMRPVGTPGSHDRHRPHVPRRDTGTRRGAARRVPACDGPKGCEFSRRREAGRAHGLRTSPQRTSLRVASRRSADARRSAFPARDRSSTTRSSFDADRRQA